MKFKASLFYLQRDVDETGISGTGIVAVGAVLPSGSCTLEWCTFHSSIGIYKNLAQIEEIHGHEGKTKVILGPVPEEPPAKKTRKRKSKDEQGKI